MALILLWRRGVALRILIDGTPPAQTVRLEGRLSRDLLPELDRLIAGRGESLPRVDVTHLISADPEGVAALRILRARGAEIRGASPYLRLLLGEPVG